MFPWRRTVSIWPCIGCPGSLRRRVVAEAPGSVHPRQAFRLYQLDLDAMIPPVLFGAARRVTQHVLAAQPGADPGGDIG